MIYVEIRFGPINGNAITIDKELSVTSDNAIANKPVALALKEINDKLSQVPQEVVSVADYNALTAITDPQTSVVYITEDTQDIWVWDGLVFVKSTGKIIDDTIYVNNVDELLTMQLTSDKYYNVFVPTSGQLAERYTLVYSSNFVRTLAGRIGWAVSSFGNAWSWNKYSYEGHTHSTDDINGFSEAIYDAVNNKQDKTSNELTTTSKTIVGAINEVNKSRIIAINFYDVLDYAMWHNLIGDIQIIAIDMTNIKAAFISDGDTLVRSNIVDLLKSGPISIANNKPITIEIERSYEGFAALTLKYK